MRSKWRKVDDINEEKKTATLYWLTQEGFDRYDLNGFMSVVRDVVKDVLNTETFGINDVVTFKVEVESRNGNGMIRQKKTYSKCKLIL